MCNKKERKRIEDVVPRDDFIKLQTLARNLNYNTLDYLANKPYITRDEYNWCYIQVLKKFAETPSHDINQYDIMIDYIYQKYKHIIK